MIRREALRLLGMGAVAGLAAACQLVAPPEPQPVSTSQPQAPLPTPTQLPVPTPTPAPTDVPAAIPSVRVAIDLDPDTLDPAGQTNPTISSIVDAMVETLVRLQPDGTVSPGLARKWEVSSDGRVYTFDLRPDVRFHDGSSLTS